MIKMIKLDETTHYLLKVRAAKLKLTMGQTVTYLLKRDDPNTITEDLMMSSERVEETDEDYIDQFIADLKS